VKQLRRALDQLANGDVLMVTRWRRFRARQQLFTLNVGRFSQGLSDSSPQSDKTVSRETLWYDWQPKNAQGLIRRTALSEVESRGKLVFVTGCRRGPCAAGRLGSNRARQRNH
jgi:hypothetical protein